MKFLLCMIIVLHQNHISNTTIDKDKSGRPLPVCSKNQQTNKEKPCRKLTIWQNVSNRG